MSNTTQGSFEPLVLPHIEPGEYPLQFCDMRFNPNDFRGSAKLYLNFEIANGPHIGQPTTRIYNVDVRESKERGTVRKRWQAKRNGDLVTEFLGAFGDICNPESFFLHTIPLRDYYSRYKVLGRVDYQKVDSKKRVVDSRTRKPLVREILKRIEMGEHESLPHSDSSHSNSSHSNSSFGSQTPPTPTTPTLVETESEADGARDAGESLYHNAPDSQQQLQNANDLAFLEWQEDGL